MRRASIVSLLLLATVLGVGSARADRPIQKREQADYILLGKVTAVYARETTGYRQYVVEIAVDQVEKGTGVKSRDIFRAFCYQRKEGKGGLEFDTAGHSTVPKEGQRVKAFVNRANGRNEGAYPDWIDLIGVTLK